MNIRIMTPEDYDQVYDLWSKTPGMCLRGYDDSREGITKFILKNPYSNFVAEKDGSIIGAILSSNDGRRGYIYHATVRSDFRKQGIGKKLLGKVYDEWKKEGIAKAGLLVLKDNKTGNEFWISRQWQERTELNYYSKDIE